MFDMEKVFAVAAMIGIAFVVARFFYYFAEFILVRAMIMFRKARRKVRTMDMPEITIPEIEISEGVKQNVRVAKTLFGYSLWVWFVFILFLPLILTIALIF